MTAFRSIENGFSIVRTARNGLSLAIDYQGHVLGASDYFFTDPAVMVTSVPTKGVKTAYTVIGDSFAYLCTLVLILLIYRKIK